MLALRFYSKLVKVAKMSDAYGSVRCLQKRFLKQQYVLYEVAFRAGLTAKANVYSESSSQMPSTNARWATIAPGGRTAIEVRKLWIDLYDFRQVLSASDHDY